MLSNLDSIHISAVLEDCADQLAILGHIMPSSLEGRLDSNQVHNQIKPNQKLFRFKNVAKCICSLVVQIVDDELGEILQGQKDIEMRYESVSKSCEVMHALSLRTILLPCYFFFIDIFMWVFIQINKDVMH